MSTALNLQDARALERIKINELMKEMNTAAITEVGQLRTKFIAAGQGPSGMVELHVRQARLDHFERFAFAVIDYRSELIRRVPELASESELDSLKRQLHEMVDDLIRELRNGNGVQGRGVPNMSAQDGEGTGMKHKIDQKLQAVLYESRLPAEPPSTGPGNISISADRGSLINLGSITKSIVSTLHQETKKPRAVRRSYEASQGH